jgi:C-terminal processing protease CtpA/Prc
MPQTEIDILIDVSRKLSSAGIRYMLTGSFAMNYYAQPRMTRDIDLVVDLSVASIETIMRLFEADYYISEESVADAIARRSIFNIIHNDSVIKVDCIVLKDEPYRYEEFARRREIDIGDARICIVSREDLILSKLFWARDSRSEVQLRDVRNLLSADCDMNYLHSRAEILGVDKLMKEAFADYE